MLRVGDPAPDFELVGTDDAVKGGRPYRLGDFRGRPVVLVFYPGDNTPVCTRQLNSYTHDIGAFREVGAQMLAISPQSIESHERFSAHHGGFPFPLLADDAKDVGRAYDIIGPLGFYRRSTFVVDAEGMIRYAHRALGGITFRPTDELVDAIRTAS